MECYCFSFLFIVISHGVHNISLRRRTEYPQDTTKNPQLTTVFLDFSGMAYIYRWGGGGGTCMVVLPCPSERIILVNYHKVYKSVGLQVSQGLLILWVNS